MKADKIITTDGKLYQLLAYYDFADDICEEIVDSCEGCAFMRNKEWELPCLRCKRNMKDYWNPKVIN